MKVIVIGATGTIGRAVADALATEHEVVRASRQGGVKVEIEDPRSIAALFRQVKDVDAVVSCAGNARFVLLGQVELIRQALRGRGHGPEQRRDARYGRVRLRSAVRPEPSHEGLGRFRRAPRATAPASWRGTTRARPASSRPDA